MAALRRACSARSGDSHTRKESDMEANGRVIVGCTHGDEDPDRVVVAYLTAGAALDQGKEVVMWLTSEGVRLALRGYVDPIRADLDPPIKRVHDQFIDKGGRF